MVWRILLTWLLLTLLLAAPFHLAMIAVHEIRTNDAGTTPTNCSRRTRSDEDRSQPLFDTLLAEQPTDRSNRPTWRRSVVTSFLLASVLLAANAFAAVAQRVLPRMNAPRLQQIIDPWGALIVFVLYLVATAGVLRIREGLSWRLAGTAMATTAAATFIGLLFLAIVLAALGSLAEALRAAF